MKLQPAVKKELLHIAIGTVICGVLMNIVFLIIRMWNLPVLFGSLLGCGWAILNFLLLGLSVQYATADADEKRSKQKLQFSYSMRMLGSFAVIILGLTLSCFNWVAVVIPLLFPRITIAFMQITGMYKPDKNDKTDKTKDGDKAE